MLRVTSPDPPPGRCHNLEHNFPPSLLNVPALPHPAAGLCITVVVSYLSHSQLWGVATEDGSVLLGGRTNRALQVFADEVVALGGKQEEEDPAVAAGEQDRSSSWY